MSRIHPPNINLSDRSVQRDTQNPDTITAGRRRVNSRRRLQHAQAIGCHSVDGTHLAYGPDRKLPELLGWLTALSSR